LSTPPTLTPRISSTSARPIGWPVGDHRERLEGRGRQARRPLGELGALDRLGVLGAGEDLPAPALLDQLDRVPVVGVVVVRAQLVERRADAVGPAAGSSSRSSASGTARGLAKSAASSSRASGLTGRGVWGVRQRVAGPARDLDGAERATLREPHLAELGHLEQREQRAQHLPRLGVVRDHVRPPGARPERQQRAHLADGAGYVERARHHVVHHRLAGGAQHPIHRRQELGERHGGAAGRGRRQVGGELALRHRPAREAAAAPLAEQVEVVDHLAHLLVLEEPAHELRARVLPRFLVAGARQEELRLDPTSRAAMSR
jgi:hypothetical protein